MLLRGRLLFLRRVLHLNLPLGVDGDKRADIGVGVAVIARNPPGDFVLGPVLLDRQERIGKLLVSDLLDGDRLINLLRFAVRADSHQLENEMGLG